jgi:predicted AAA+ superfamily ATPase
MISAEIRLHRIFDGGVLMDYIQRTLEQKILEINEDYSCLLLIGPRQVGKTTMLEHLMEGTNRQKVTLDDTENRRLAKTDPALFLELHPAPVLIDEVQYAPELFSYIKINVDNGAAPGSYWLTGSQAFQLMELAQESLAGRTAIVHMSALSQSELYGDHWSEPLSLDLQKLNSRKEHLAACGSAEMFERIWNGGMPGHRSGRFKDRDVFYSSYIQTYINRDVTDMIPGVDKLLFADFIRAAACRVGQMLNTHDIAGDVGVSDDTAKRWLQVLEKSEVIFYLRPYSNNLLKRTVKTPKMYFFDTGLVAYLTKYSSPEILMNGAINGAILENYTVAEIRKTWLNSAKECLMHYYRDKDTNEIDMVVEADGELHPLEIKKSTNPGTELASAFKVLDKGSVPRGVGAILCLREELSAIDRSTFILPIWMI